MPRTATRRAPRRKAAAKPAAPGNGRGPALAVEVVALSSLRPHPRNYRHHPDDQLTHIEASIREHGFYRNVVVAADGTILAGHGVTQAARKMGIERIPVVRLPFGPEDPRSLRVLAGDNEILRLAEVDDRMLTDMLKELAALDGLVGTGFDASMLAALDMVTRPPDQRGDKDHDGAWVGMPEFTPMGPNPRIIVSFANAEDQRRFFDEVLRAKIINKRVWNVWTLW